MIHYKINILEELKKKDIVQLGYTKNTFCLTRQFRVFEREKYFSCDLKQDLYHAQSAARRSD